MKRENIFISEDYTKKRVAAVKFVAPGDVPDFECSIHFGEEGNDVTMQNCIIKNNLIVKCSPEDTYDFETGALIALMKMCGKNKVTKACDELYKDDNYKNALQEMTENNEKLIEENNYLKYVISCRESAIKSLENTRDLLINKNNELIEENEKLKLDCEKLQHGYNDMIFCGGRQNGKQYTFLKKLFKSIPKDKVEAAYKEAYDKWIKLPSLRERMWDDILKEGRTPVYVKREDIHAFLEECQVTGIKWATGKMPLETMPFHMSKGYDGIYFFVMTSLDISKSTPGVKEFRHVMCWWMTASDEEARNSVKYIAPMRWDLFEKGRIYIRVKAEHFEEFKKACKAHLEKEPLSPFTYYSNGDVIVCYTDDHFRLTKTLNGFKKRSIVNWEDVR